MGEASRAGCGERQRALGAEASAEGQDGVAAGLGPAHAGALHPALDELIGGGLDRARSQWEAVEPERGVVHPLGGGGEGAAFEPEHLGGVDRRGLGA